MAEVYIRTDPKTNIVTFIHKTPFDPTHGLHKTRDELAKTGFFVSNFPEPNTAIGKRAIAYYDHERKQVYYEYETVPFSDKDRLEMLEETVNSLLLTLSNTVNESTPRAVAPAPAIMTLSAAGPKPIATTVEVDTTNQLGFAKYLAYQIYQGKMDKNEVLGQYTFIKNEIERLLTEWETIPALKNK